VLANSTLRKLAVFHLFLVNAVSNIENRSQVEFLGIISAFAEVSRTSVQKEVTNHEVFGVRGNELNGVLLSFLVSFGSISVTRTNPHMTIKIEERCPIGASRLTRF